MDPKTYELPSYTYKDNAVGNLFWNGNRHQSSIGSYQITIAPNLEFLLRNNIVNFQFDPVASLNKRTISDKFNQGPYIDIFNCSFEPLNKNECVNKGDSIGSTTPKPYSQDFSSNSTCGLEIGAQFDSKGGLGVPGVHASSGIGVTTRITINEFEGEKREDGEKKILSFYLQTCSDADGVPKKYDVNYPSTLKCSKINARLATGLFGAWVLFPDVLSTLPACATSSVGLNWALNYKFTGGPKQRFQWITEVRTVFASNDQIMKEAPYNPMGTILHWIKTVHQIVQIFEITIKDDQTLDINLESRTLNKICLSGYDREQVFGDEITKIYKNVTFEIDGKSKSVRSNEGSILSTFLNIFSIPPNGIELQKVFNIPF